MLRRTFRIPSTCRFCSPLSADLYSSASKTVSGILPPVLTSTKQASFSIGRARRKHQRLPSSLLIENASARLASAPQHPTPTRFRSSLATNQPRGFQLRWALMRNNPRTLALWSLKVGQRLAASLLAAAATQRSRSRLKSGPYPDTTISLPSPPTRMRIRNVG